MQRVQLHAAPAPAKAAWNLTAAEKGVAGGFVRNLAQLILRNQGISRYSTNFILHNIKLFLDNKPFIFYFYLCIIKPLLTVYFLYFKYWEKVYLLQIETLTRDNTRRKTVGVRITEKGVP